MATASTYLIRLMFEWGGGCLWSGNEAARRTFDIGSIESRLPISDVLRAELSELSEWHDRALNWNYPPDPSPWSDEEFERFDAAALVIKSKIEQELGSDYEVVYVPLGRMP